MISVFNMVWYIALLAASVLLLLSGKIEYATLFLVLACLAQRGAYRD